jgi:hypothetical protein
VKAAKNQEQHDIDQTLQRENVKAQQDSDETPKREKVKLAQEQQDIETPKKQTGKKDVFEN